MNVQIKSMCGDIYSDKNNIHMGVIFCTTSLRMFGKYM